jgi:bifunctional ADP-heptose synthase (sugar kinase/adenylyltransferase)
MKFLVIGDVCIDIFIYGVCDRICPEAPVPVFIPTEKFTNMGMAGNVINNIIAMGNECDRIVNSNSIIKTRYIEKKTNQMLMRLDEDDFVLGSYKRNREELIGYDGIIISDYGKGFLNEGDINYIASHANCSTFLQTNKILSTWCSNIDFIKINETEYEKTKYLLSKQNSFLYEKLIVTLGSKGCRHKDKQYPVERKVNIRSLAGAGDTFLAGFATEYIRTSRNVEKAIKFAQSCALKVVQDNGVTTI